MQRFVFSGVSVSDLVEEVARLFSLEKTEETVAEERYWDTFDWSLVQKNLVVWQLARQIRLLALDSDEEQVVDWPSKINYPQAGDLQGPGADAVIKELGIRALVPHLVVNRIACHCRLPMGEQTKDAGLVTLERLVFPEAHESLVLHLQPRRGYSERMRPLIDWCKERGGKKIAQVDFALLANLANIEPGAYSNKVRLQLQPKLPARLAVFRILDGLFQIVRQNQWGVLEDVDSEFLHDYRVSIRRMRSIVDECRDVLPEELYLRFKKDFRRLGKATNRLRDLDVYLLRCEEYQTLVPQILRPGLETLFAEFARKREKALKKLRKQMKDSSYERLIDDWDRFFVLQRTVQSAPALPTVLETACRTISYRYHRILDQGRIIDETSPDDQVHALRIECKKLRYLLEVFASLFPADEIERFVRLLKGLQDNLGQHNDLVVQQRELMAFAQGKQPNKSDALSVAAVGALVGVLAERQRHTRHHFAVLFTEFVRSENQRFMEKLESSH
ncbi:CHAD domain-containing protein [candidate division KSB1 bacterium]|nr:CHAD domain-containing protein [candidate division KSB1 bacterium]